MKKFLFLGIALTAISSAAMAQNWGYATPNNNAGYNQQRRPAYQQPVQRQYQAPAKQQPRYQAPGCTSKSKTNATL